MSRRRPLLPLRCRLTPEQAAHRLRKPVAEVYRLIRKPDGLTAYRSAGERRLWIEQRDLAAYQQVR